MFKFIETVRVWNLGFAWADAWRRVHVFGQTATPLRGEIDRLTSRLPPRV